MGQIKFITSLMLISLFAIAIVSYAIDFGDDNDAVIKLGDNPEFTSLNSKIINDQDAYLITTNQSGTSIFQSQIERAGVTTTTGQVFQQIGTIINTFKSVIGTINNNLLGGKGGGFGVIFTGFVTLISIIGILVAWKTWVGRNPD